MGVVTTAQGLQYEKEKQLRVSLNASVSCSQHVDTLHVVPTRSHNEAMPDLSLPPELRHDLPSEEHQIQAI